MELMILANNLEFRWNVAEVKAAVTAAVAKYKGLVVTEENLADMERTQKEIAGLRIKLNTFRIETKKLLAAPANTFDAEVKELTAIIEEAEQPLLDQLTKYEEARVAKRTDELMTFARAYDDEIGLRPEYFKYEVPAKLTGRSVTDKAAKAEIRAAIDDLLTQQGADDEAKAEERKREDEARILREQRDLMITILCNSHSAFLQLKTPVTNEDILQLITPETPVLELPNIIEAECKKRKQIELAAAKPAPMKTAEDLPPASTSVPQIGANYIPQTPERPPWTGPPAAEWGPPPVPPPARPGGTSPLFVVVLRFPAISIVNAGALKMWLEQAGIPFEVISQDPIEKENEQ